MWVRFANDAKSAQLIEKDGEQCKEAFNFGDSEKESENDGSVNDKIGNAHVEDISKSINRETSTLIVRNFKAAMIRGNETDDANGNVDFNGDIGTTSSRKPDLATVVKSINSANKATVILKEKATHRVKLRERLKLKERMRELADKRLTMKQVFSRYVESSTLHGFRYTCMQTYLIRRVLWACLMILGACYFILKLKDGLVMYYNYPFSTKATLVYVEKLQYPAISFCPINQFKYSEIKNSSLHKLYQDNMLPIGSNWTYPGYDVPGPELVNETAKASFSIGDIFQECDYISRDTDAPGVNYRNCSKANFTNYFSESGQLCYTLNSGNVGHKMLEVDHEGLRHGYELMFDVFNNEAVSHNMITGIKVIIHDQAEPPVSSNGFIITPGFKSFISMQTIQVCLASIISYKFLASTIMSRNYNVRTFLNPKSSFDYYYYKSNDILFTQTFRSLGLNIYKTRITY